MSCLTPTDDRQPGKHVIVNGENLRSIARSLHSRAWKGTLDEDSKTVVRGGGGSNRKISVTAPQLKDQGQLQSSLVLLADSASLG